MILKLFAQYEIVHTYFYSLNVCGNTILNSDCHKTSHGYCTRFVESRSKSFNTCQLFVKSYDILSSKNTTARKTSNSAINAP